MALAALALQPAVAAGNATVSVTRDGAWSWFGDPRAVYHEGVHRRTYVGWITRRGDIRVASFDHGSRRWSRHTLSTGVQVDDHNNPSLLIRPDGRIVAFWSSHFGEELYYRISDRPEEVDAWSPRRAVGTNTSGRGGYTYPNPIGLGGDRLALFWRGGNLQPTVSFSGDGGLTWSAARTFLDVPKERPYIKYERGRRGEIHFAFTAAHPLEGRSGIYHSSYHAGGFHRADGSRTGELAEGPLAAERADVVYAPSPGDAGSWVHDIAVDARGRPVIVYTAFPTRDDHRYRYVRWDGRRWRDHEITHGGDTVYGRRGRRATKRERSARVGLAVVVGTLPSLLVLAGAGRWLRRIPRGRRLLAVGVAFGLALLGAAAIVKLVRGPPGNLVAIDDIFQPYYSGGVVLDHEDPSVVYLSREVRGFHEIERWRTRDGGAHWTRRPVTSSSSVPNMRPFTPRGARSGELDVLWMRGPYPGYQRFQTELVARSLGERR